MWYFQFLVILCVVNIFYYAIVTRGGVSVEGKDTKDRKRDVRNLKAITYALLVCFNIFVFWTLIAFV